MYHQVMAIMITTPLSTRLPRHVALIPTIHIFVYDSHYTMSLNDKLFVSSFFMVTLLFISFIPHLTNILLSLSCYGTHAKKGPR